MQFSARCAAVVSKNGASMVLLKFDPLPGHLMGEIPKQIGELKDGKTYRITIEEEGD
jgi:hypothetical protein